MKIFEVPTEVIKNRKLVSNLAKNDLKARFAGSNLGIVWAFVQPIITIIVYWFVFEKAIGAGSQITKGGLSVPYILWLSAGLIPWFYFSEAWMNGTNCLLEYNYLVKKVVFNISVLPVVKAVSSLFTHVVLVLFMILLYVLYGYYPDISVIQVIYYSFCAFALALSLSYFTSAVTVFFRDMQQIINVFMQMLIWGTPIMWNIDYMEQLGKVSPALSMILKLNPMYYIVLGYRRTLIYHEPFWNEPALTIYFWCVTIVLFLIGTTVFRKLRPHFADIL